MASESEHCCAKGVDVLRKWEWKTQVQARANDLVTNSEQRLCRQEAEDGAAGDEEVGKTTREMLVQRARINKVQRTRADR